MRKHLKNIFSDKSSIVIKAILENPGREWKIRDFVRVGVSFALANRVLNRAWELGLVARVKKGRNSFSVLRDRKGLLKLWSKSYSFSDNLSIRLHYKGKSFYKDWDVFIQRSRIQYALTLFSASRLISPYVLVEDHFVYVDVPPEKFMGFVENLKNQLGLLELKSGGNVTVSLPIYKSSIFRDRQVIRGHPCVSNLQLYLDLISYPAGSEEAKHLTSFFKKKGTSFV
ncbi:MAG: hypothetical protein HYT97_06365 [Elusimicrobia bacterium]|nr:hypothetical protein [Elusimicrobiota bacterium]